MSSGETTSTLGAGLDALGAIDRADVAESTKQQYKRALRRFWRETGAPITDARALEEHAQTLQVGARAPESGRPPAHGGPGRASQGRGDARQRGPRDGGPLPDRRDPRRDQGGQVKDAAIWLTAPEVRRLVGACDLGTPSGRRDRIVVCLLVAAGLGRAEAAALTFDAIKRQGDRTVLEVHGKGSKTRIVPISDALADALEDWRQELGGGLVCRSCNGHLGESIGGQGVLDIVARLGAAIGKLALRPHDLRRTYCQLGYEAGMSVAQLSTLLGHSSIQTTQRYLDLDLDLECTASDFAILSRQRPRPRARIAWSGLFVVPWLAGRNLPKPEKWDILWGQGTSDKTGQEQRGMAEWDFWGALLAAGVIGGLVGAAAEALLGSFANYLLEVRRERHREREELIDVARNWDREGRLDRFRDADLKKADLSGVHLEGADLRFADLRRAILAMANLHGANLRGANLRGANLVMANLHGANLIRANLIRADLRGTSLIRATLFIARLNGANLHGADLVMAKLHGADLHGADLHGADLHGADLRRANLRRANLRGANLVMANLHGARVSNKQLARAQTLEGATMPDGRVYQGEPLTPEPKETQLVQAEAELEEPEAQWEEPSEPANGDDRRGLTE